MSIDTGNEPYSPMDQNPIANVEQPRGSGKKWLFGGCGCLAVLGLLCLVGGVYAYMTFFKPAIDFVLENQAIITSSPVIQEKIGPDVTVGPPNQSQQQEGNEVIMDMRFPVSGSNGDGTVVLKGRFSLGSEVKREAFYLEKDGEQFSLDPDAQFDLPIDDGL